MPTSSRRTSSHDPRSQCIKAAQEHMSAMEARFGAEIARSRQELVKLDSLKQAQQAARKVQPTPPAEKNLPQLSFMRADSVQAVLEHGRGIASQCDLTVLDFASFKFPAGGYDKGFFGQEQALCASSTLANVLLCQQGWYRENQNSHINCELYKNRALIVPKVRFERDNYHSYADVLVVAAPNAARATSAYRIDQQTQLGFLKDRMQFMLACAAAANNPKLVVGAWGTGIFGWDAHTVAVALFEALLATPYAFEQVIVAVPQQRSNEHDDIFEHVFATFPEVNTAFYQSREERERLFAAAIEAKATEADDDEEEDWRKYLH